ncbi:MAG: methyl-accepting chemotaxis protein [Deltaproteobacteria bacterium]|nr:methyl-accepting chemotaxis protein [Deltaproteobacteria bacterium]
MAAAYNQITIESGHGPDKAADLTAWREIITPSIAVLREMAGTTEDEFLQIGSQLQDFHQRSSEITSMANRLMEAVSGNQALSLIERLRRMMADTEAYLAAARGRSRDSCETLERILDLLDQVSVPLEGFQKMYKVLRMLSTSTKIESARLGEMGTGFLTLAMDVEKLSYLVNDKSGNILKQRQVLAGMIADNLKVVHSSESTQDREVNAILESTTTSLDELVSVNERCSRFGSLVFSVSGEVSGSIGEVVASMQSHDITRQQVEHIVEALERLALDLRAGGDAAADMGRQRRLIIEAGDVCELQSAQLRHASSELFAAVCSIGDNLREVARRQARMAEETLAATGIGDSAGHSFVEGMSRGLSTVTAVLANCARADQEMSTTMKKVASTIGEIAGFVTDIEDIGSEIDLIALNSQIKAAHTGREGAALGVLAEAIKRLSVDAVTQTEAVSQTLIRVNEVTEHLFQEVEEDNEQAVFRITLMEEELKEILGTLGSMNMDLVALLSGLNNRVGSLTDAIDRATAGIGVHEQTKRTAEEVMAGLDRIVVHARKLEPASTEFKENLRHMEERYTMQSERHIHETIARRREGGTAVKAQVAEQPKMNGGGESEFGDNVDFF